MASKFLEFKISDEMLRKAKEQTANFGGCDPLDHMDTERSRLVGFLGEDFLQRAYPEAIYVGVSGDKSADFLLASKPIDVKSGWLNFDPPKERYHCNVEKKREKAHFQGIYVFAFVKHDFKKGWLLGWRSVEGFKKWRKFEAKGSPDYSGKGTIGGDRWSIKVEKLKEMELLLPYLSGEIV